MNERIKGLYKTQILAHSKNPFQEGELEGATHVLQAYNSMCGDKYTLYLKIENDRVEDAYFKGYGCAISKASSSILTKKSIGKSMEELDALVRLFLKIVSAKEEVSPEDLTDEEELLAFSAAREFPEREICATMSWKVVQEELLKE
ncbi:MAG TPA: SUF system NifU family Fe-S cluster assembly protein [Cytophagales bacterium]|nr:SUF system NifU family Fe-S cluster assembly protein [Cytophagales bacterium]HAA20600.1 SUF system NifU family Fe-S cluster assembly protein [Cytophagales bacterium]HAP61100.1 SUF system NifU family Fe-S cluster assembly protein [Cytophagales bacterium]